MKTNLERTEEEIKELFFNLKKFADVANLFEVPPHVLKYNLYRQDYKEFAITKKSGSIRTLHAPCNSIKILQKKFLRILNICITKEKSCVHSFQKGNGRGIKTNAEVHRKKKTLLTIDLKDFYPSITFPRVYGLFRKPPFEFNQMVAATLANLVCYKNQLPQGAPTSPFISNLIVRRLDNALLKIACANKLTYSRYADDLSFSTNRRIFPLHISQGLFSDHVDESSPLLLAIRENGFAVNLSKSRIQNSDQRQLVTGIVVNNRKMHVRREVVRAIRAALHSWRKHGYEHAKEVYIDKYKKILSRRANASENLAKVLKGKIDHIGFVRGHDDPLYLKFLFEIHRLNSTLLSAKEYARKLKPFEDRDFKIKNSLWLIEAEGDDYYQGTAFAVEGIDGLITCDHCVPNVQGLFIWASQPQIDPEKRIMVNKVWSDRALDIAVLSVPDSKNFKPLSVGNSERLSQLDDVLIGGFPNFGKDSHSLIAAKLMARREFMGEKSILLDRGIVVGNSGGPVMSSEGKVIGVVQKGAEKRDEQYKTENHGAIPIERVIEKYHEHLKDAGTVS